MLSGGDVCASGKSFENKRPPAQTGEALATPWLAPPCLQRQREARLGLHIPRAEEVYKESLTCTRLYLTVSLCGTFSLVLNFTA